MLFIVLLLSLFSCYYTESKIIKMSYSATQTEEVKSIVDFVLRKYGFHVIKNRDNQMEFLRELNRSPEQTEEKKVSKSRQMFIQLFFDQQTLYAKSSVIVKDLELKKADDVSDNNIRKVKTYVDNIEFNKKEGILLADILSSISNKLRKSTYRKTVNKIEEISESMIDPEIAKKLTPSYMGDVE